MSRHCQEKVAKRPAMSLLSLKRLGRLSMLPPQKPTDKRQHPCTHVQNIHPRHDHVPHPGHPGRAGLFGGWRDHCRQRRFAAGCGLLCGNGVGCCCIIASEASVFSHLRVAGHFHVCVRTYLKPQRREETAACSAVRSFTPLSISFFLSFFLFEEAELKSRNGQDAKEVATSKVELARAAWRSAMPWDKAARYVVSRRQSDSGGEVPKY